jgi:glutamine synthetase
MNQNYALTNPVSLILDKPRTDFTREDFLRIIEEKQIKQIVFHYTGLDSKLKELKLPVTNRKQAEYILADGERVDGSSLFKGLVDVALSDLYVAPAYQTAFLNPFEEGSLDFICRYLTKDGEMAPFALDNILQKANQLLKENTGCDLLAMGELEFFLMNNPGPQLYTTAKQRGYHASGPYIKTGKILDEMVYYISLITGAVKYAHSEVGYIESVRSNLEEIKGKQAEQLEIEFQPTPVEETADVLVLSRWLIRNIMHIHMQLSKNGKNIMTTKKGVLSEKARELIGGLCTYADSLTAFGNTVSSAYLRLVPNQEAPTKICWSDMNRSTMIRVPLGWAKADNLANKLNPQQKMKSNKSVNRQTIELRSPDGSSIMHLLLAGITMAAEWGLTHSESADIADKLHVTGNIFKDKKLMNKLPSLPHSCVSSAEILLKKRKLYERDDIFPKSIIDFVANLLREEDDEHMNQKLVDLPADDRLYETRKIMHKDLHRH